MGICPNLVLNRVKVVEMVKRIEVKPSCFAPSFIMEITIPEGRDAEEYIDELLDGILTEDFRYNCEWDFI